LPELREVLADDEIERAARFVRPSHRDRYIAGRAEMRRILGLETGRDPRDIRFRYGPNGKPSIDGGPEFNLSHSSALAILGVSRDGPLGIDIEKPRQIEDSVARHHFSPTEYADLNRMPAGDWLEGFYRCWTRKEAVIKASGLGLSMPLDSFDVSLVPDEPARLNRIEGDDPAAWCLAHFEPAPEWAGALAARTGGQDIELTWREVGR
jgi:4'-phosphopantetheinyl transferase